MELDIGKRHWQPALVPAGEITYRFNDLHGGLGTVENRLRITNRHSNDEYLKQGDGKTHKLTTFGRCRLLQAN